MYSTPNYLHRFVFIWAAIIMIAPLGIVACGGGGGGSDAPASVVLVSAAIGVEGGTVVVPATEPDYAGITVTIPAGILTEPTLISIKRLDASALPSSAPANIKPLGKPFVLEPSGLQFEDEVTVSYPLAIGTAQEPNHTPKSSDCDIYLVSSEGWTELPTTFDGNLFTAAMHHFSCYQLAEKGECENELISFTDPAGYFDLQYYCNFGRNLDQEASQRAIDPALISTAIFMEPSLLGGKILGIYVVTKDEYPSELLASGALSDIVAFERDGYFADNSELVLIQDISGFTNNFGQQGLYMIIKKKKLLADQYWNLIYYMDTDQNIYSVQYLSNNQLDRDEQRQMVYGCKVLHDVTLQYEPPAATAP